MRQENSLTKFAVLNIDSLKSFLHTQVAQALDSIIEETVTSGTGDTEWMLSAGLLYISRLESDAKRSERFMRKMRQDSVLTDMANVRNPMRLGVKQPGSFDTLFWKEHYEPLPDLQSNDIEIAVKTVGVNAKVRTFHAGK